MPEFKPHEFAKDEDQFELVLDTRWQGGHWRVAIIASEPRPLYLSLVFWRENGPLLHAMMAFDRPRRPKNLAPATLKAFEDSLNKEAWKRHLFLNLEHGLRQVGEVSRFGLGLFPNGEAYWSDTSLRSWAYFQWSETNERDFLLAASATELLARLKEEPTASRFAYAQRFTGLTKEERWAEIWRWHRGNLDEWRRVLAGALLVHAEFWPTKVAARLEVSLHHDARADADYSYHLAVLDGQFHSSSSSWNRDFELAETLDDVVEEVCSWFAPEFDGEKVEQHLCLRRFIASEFKFDFFVEPSSLSSHERLEALLSWREWRTSTPRQPRKLKRVDDLVFS